VKKIIPLLLLAVCAAGAAFSDTLHLRTGGEIEGTFVGYENNEFVFELADGTETRYRANRVSKVTIDRSRSRFPWGEGDQGLQRRAVPQPERSTVNVPLDEKWVRSPISVRRGDEVRVEASGTVRLDGRTSTGPEGLGNRRDPNAPMPRENDGALIASIGLGFGASTFPIGRERTFVADRDGILHFTVNHGNKANTSGAFRVDISVGRQQEAAGAGSRQWREKTITIPASEAWTDTGIDLRPNMTLEISAEGQIRTGLTVVSGPDGNLPGRGSSVRYPVQDQGVGALIAKIRAGNGRESNPRYIGSSLRTTTGPNDTGRLYLGINDNNVRDNSGSFQVKIRY